MQQVMHFDTIISSPECSPRQPHPLTSIIAVQLASPSSRYNSPRPCSRRPPRFVLGQTMTLSAPSSRSPWHHRRGQRKPALCDFEDKHMVTLCCGADNTLVSRTLKAGCAASMFSPSRSLKTSETKKTYQAKRTNDRIATTATTHRNHGDSEHHQADVITQPQLHRRRHGR